MKLELLSGTGTLRRQSELAALIVDAVEHGSSIGFTFPLVEAEVERYWQEVAGEVASGTKELLVALDERGRVVGTAQLALESGVSGGQCAEVQKVIVRHTMRGRGIGTMLVARLEQAAHAGGRTILSIDSGSGPGGAAIFCRRLGYTFAGSIPNRAGNPDKPRVANAIFRKLLPAKVAAAVNGSHAPRVAVAG